MITHILPLVGMVLFLGVGIVWRAWLQYRRHGHTGIALFRSGSWMQSVAEGGFCLILLATLVQALVFAIAPEALSWATVIIPSPWIGFGVQCVGIVFMIAAQLDMGVSWRVGIDEAERPGLVTDGLYRFCRNPIYLGMFVALFGMALSLPTLLSFANLLCIVAGVRYQVSQEEEYLLRTYGQAFRGYAARVGRFVPGLGKMA